MPRHASQIARVASERGRMSLHRIEVRPRRDLVHAATNVIRTSGAKAGVLYVNNYGTMPVTVQIEPFDWSQSEGKDRLVASDALMRSGIDVSRKNVHTGSGYGARISFRQ